MDTPIQLFGTPLSNYYNKIKIALLELEIPFTEVFTLPSKNQPENGSPSGKIPYMNTSRGVVYESMPMLEYLEEISPNGASCYPRDTLERARCRELIQYLELYIEHPARRLYPAAFWGQPLQPGLSEEVCEKINSGLEVLGQRISQATWLCGDTFTHADAAAWAHLNTVRLALRTLELPNLISQVLPDMNAYLKRASTRPSIQTVENDQRQAWQNLSHSRAT